MKKIILGDLFEVPHNSPIETLSLMLLSIYMTNELNGLRLIPRIKKPYTLEELRKSYEDFEEFPKDPELVGHVPSESELISQLGEKNRESQRLGYCLEYVVKPGEVIEGVPPPISLGQVIINYFKNMSNEGKLNVSYKGIEYEIPIRVSEDFIFEDKKLEKLVLGKSVKAAA